MRFLSETEKVRFKILLTIKLWTYQKFQVINDFFKGLLQKRLKLLELVLVKNLI